MVIAVFFILIYAVDMKKIWIIVSIMTCIVAPLIVEYNLPIPSGIGDWLSFLGSYLGIIPSGLIAYFVASFQIDKEHKIMKQEKNLEYLPYFNIKNNKLLYSSMRSELPIQQVRVIYFNSEDEVIKLDDNLTNLGHLFPNEPVSIPLVPTCYDRIDVNCNLVNGDSVFYTYGNGVLGAHFIKDTKGQFFPYVFENDTESQNKADLRAEGSIT